MAIIEDALDKLATLIGEAVYPDGVDQSSVANTDILIYPGWPTPEELDTDIRGGKAHISIFPRPEERIVQHSPGPWEDDVEAGTVSRVLKTQEQLVHVSIWAPTPEVRASIHRVVDVAITRTPRMLMPDNSWANLRYRNAYTEDIGQKAGIFRKDVYCNIEYATVETVTAHVILQSTVNIGELP